MNCVLDELTSRNVIFTVLSKSKILDRLELSHDFWDNFKIQNLKLKKQVGLFDVKNIEQSNIITISLNPKEYFEQFDDNESNKRELKRELEE